MVLTACIPACFSVFCRSLRCNTACSTQQCVLAAAGGTFWWACPAGEGFQLQGPPTSHWPRPLTMLTLTRLSCLGRTQPTNSCSSPALIHFEWLATRFVCTDTFTTPARRMTEDGTLHDVSVSSAQLRFPQPREPTAWPCRNHSAASSGWFWRPTSAAGRWPPPGCRTARLWLWTSRTTHPRWPASLGARSAWSPPWPGCSTGCRPGVQLGWRDLRTQTDGSTAQKHRVREAPRTTTGFQENRSITPNVGWKTRKTFQIPAN